MGIKNFTKLFNEFKIIKLNNFDTLDIKTIAVDAMSELYRALKSPITLTDKKNNPTHHIMILLSNIIERKRNNIEEIWVFDYYEKNYVNPMKKFEIEKRKKNYEYNEKKLANLINKQKISSDSEKISLNTEIIKQKKYLYKINFSIIKEFQYILTLLNIPFVITPKGFEGEHLAAILTNSKTGIADVVYTNDADALLFGAKKIILRRRNYKKKKTELLFYDRDELLRNHNITYDELIKIGIILGSDFYDDKKKKLFYRIGYRTVIKKIKSKKLDEKFLDDEFNKAFNYFKSKCNMQNLQWHNIKNTSFNCKKSIKMLVNFLVNEKNFDEKHIINKFKNYF